MENSDKMEEQLRELESNGELPPIALQASGHMFRQHAELMFSHARELESVFGELETATTTATTTTGSNSNLNIDDNQTSLSSNSSPSLPWGCSDKESYKIQQYGIQNTIRQKENDPIHELDSLRREMRTIRKDIQLKRKRLLERGDDVNYFDKKGTIWYQNFEERTWKLIKTESNYTPLDLDKINMKR